MAPFGPIVATPVPVLYTQAIASVQFKSVRNSFGMSDTLYALMLIMQ